MTTKQAGPLIGRTVDKGKVKAWLDGHKITEDVAEWASRAIDMIAMICRTHYAGQHCETPVKYGLGYQTRVPMVGRVGGSKRFAGSGRGVNLATLITSPAVDLFDAPLPLAEEDAAFLLDLIARMAADIPEALPFDVHKGTGALIIDGRPVACSTLERLWHEYWRQVDGHRVDARPADNDTDYCVSVVVGVSGGSFNPMARQGDATTAKAASAIEEVRNLMQVTVADTVPAKKPTPEQEPRAAAKA